MMRNTLIVCGLVLGLCAPAAAQVQQPGPAVEAAPPTLDPKACADRDRLTLGDTHELQSKGTTGESTSDKLARTDGVICPPPDLDPAIRAPAPETGRTPVIPPPGSPGGDPLVQPK